MTALTRFWREAAIVLLAGLVFYACHARDQALRQEGALRERLVVLERKTRGDSVADALADAVVQKDTIVLTKWTTRYDTVRKTLRVTDTIAVKQYVAVTDSVVRQCRQTVTDLGVACARKDTLIADLRGQLAIRARLAPAPTPFTLGLAAGYGATWTGGTLRTGPSVTVGIVWHPF